MVNGSCLRGHHCPPPLYFSLKMEGDISFVTANHYRLEHKQGEQCQVQAERTKYPRCRKKEKKHGSHMKTTPAELTSSRTHQWWWGLKQVKTELYTLNSLVFCSLLPAFWGKNMIFFFLNSQQLLVRLATHFATKEIRSPCKYVFSCVYECVWVCVCGKHEFWPRLLLQRESPGLAACSLDWSWWKTWVTRFTAPRAADENGEVRES